MSIDVIGNFLTIIRNGLMASKPFVVAPHARMIEEIAKILKNEGFIRDFVVTKREDGPGSDIKLFLKYVNGESVIHEIQRVSKPSLRKYAGAKKVKPVIGGLGISILSTNKGIATQKQAKELGLGGEVLCTVW